MSPVIDVEPRRALRTIPTSEATLAKLASDPDLTIQLTEQETKEATEISERARSTS